MKRSKLDAIDKNILKKLQHDGRITNVELAKCVGISAPPCLRRVRALENAGYINGYYTRINHHKLGYELKAFAFVKLENNSEEHAGEFEKLIMSVRMVRECFRVAGEGDFLLKIVAKNEEDYKKFVAQHLSKENNVVQVKSSFSIRSLKQLPGVPIE